ncbi:hypothetical protein GOBAR_AA00277 [Gossypium barbadense]|uniref:ubiquitinyl hydrolase 1 n=1 Tax=Gossypium barbadense TaxID=3634 RepID=A0A2P5YXM2_GOSBA|nr:hypothetical protein GOBAR_AA00277 [Gossypium barbadense]
MTWQPSLLSEKRKKGPPLGLRNLGNSSWITRSLTLDLTLDAPSKIQSCIKIFAEHFRFGRQEDAHEFLRYVIDACHNTCLRLKKLRRQGSEGGGEAVNGNTVVKEIFGGALQSQVKCLGCGAESNKVDEIMDISLDILHSGSLKEAMHKFFQPEVLDGNNKYKCDNCKKLVAARKQLSIRQAPNILVIQLKRFEGILGAKIDRLITFEEVLVLSSFMSKASQEVLSEKVYILFFSRTNQRPGSFGTTVSSNGAKPRDSNGSEAPKILKAVQLKPVQTKLCVEQSSQKDKVGKPSSNSRVKFSISEKSGLRKLSVTSNGKVGLHKTQNIAVNGVSMDSIQTKKNERDTSSLMNRNGTDKTRKVDAVVSENGPQVALSNGNKLDSFVVNGTRSMAVGEQIDTALNDACDNSGQKKNSECSFAISGPKRKIEDSYDISGAKRKPEDSCDLSGAKRKYGDSSNSSGPKRKSEDSCNLSGPKRKSEDSSDNSVPTTKLKDSFNSGGNGKFRDSCDVSGLKKTENSGDFSMPVGKSCILLSQDDQSRAEVENMKEMLKNKASSVLRSSGWYVDVYNFMYSRKQSYALETGSTLSDNDLE